ncbi:MAG TPA: OPT/YSL family transporter, partial [Caulobacteraceae bacterium]
ALWAMLAAAILGIVFAVMETHPRLKRWTPSPTGLSLGVLLPFSSMASMFAGAVGGLIWQRASPRSAGNYLIPLASGLIAGEAIVAVIVPVLLWLGLGHG